MHLLQAGEGEGQEQQESPPIKSTLAEHHLFIFKENEYASDGGSFGGGFSAKIAYELDWPSSQFREEQQPGSSPMSRDR